MEIGNQMEEIMQAATITDVAPFRYGHDPKVMFAATRAGAERRTRERAAAAAADGRRSRPAQGLIRSLAARLARSTS